MSQTQVQELQLEAKAHWDKALALASKDQAEVTGEEREQFVKLCDEAKALEKRAADISQIIQAQASLAQQIAASPTLNTGGPAKTVKSFESIGMMAKAIHAAKFKGIRDPRLGEFWMEKGETQVPEQGEGVQWASEQKDLVENIGASGGFLVPLQQMTTVLQVPGPTAVVRPRATIVPMTARQIQWPVLDQTTTTSGRPHWYGGVLAYWTEEGEYKDETQPSFRQINLVAHKLVTYTEASDELLADSAQSLEALLASLYRGAITWYEEEAFINGTGAGQPLGVVQPACAATIAVARAVAGAIGLNDLVNMLEAFHGSDGIWLCNRRGLSNLMLLNGPAANPSYVFMPSARDAMPSTLFGYPLFFNEHCPALGTRGDIILADWRMYLVGDRQAFTIDASKHYRFRYDLTSWRGVHRVDGQPWLSAPLTWSDGLTQTSPFVVLDSAVAT